jgi:hypothetical protein
MIEGWPNLDNFSFDTEFCHVSYGISVLQEMQKLSSTKQGSVLLSYNK